MVRALPGLRRRHPRRGGHLAVLAGWAAHRQPGLMRLGEPPSSGRAMSRLVIVVTWGGDLEQRDAARAAAARASQAAPPWPVALVCLHEPSLLVHVEDDLNGSSRNTDRTNLMSLLRSRQRRHKGDLKQGAEDDDEPEDGRRRAGRSWGLCCGRRSRPQCRPVDPPGGRCAGGSAGTVSAHEPGRGRQDPDGPLLLPDGGRSPPKASAQRRACLSPAPGLEAGRVGNPSLTRCRSWGRRAGAGRTPGPSRQPLSAGACNYRTMQVHWR
jgi:hypothetical protein